MTKTIVETVAPPFDSVAWAVYLTACDMSEEGGWINEGGLFEYEHSFAYLQQALDYMRSWTVEAAQAVMKDAGCTCLQVNIDKDFYIGSSRDSCRPCVAGVYFITENNSVNRYEYYDDGGIHCVDHR